MFNTEKQAAQIQKNIVFYENYYKRSIDAYNNVERPVKHVSEFLDANCKYNLLAELDDLSFNNMRAVQKINDAGWHVVEFEIRYAQYLFSMQQENDAVWMYFCNTPEN